MRVKCEIIFYSVRKPNQCPKLRLHMEFRCEHALLYTLENNCEETDVHREEHSENAEINRVS
jgi:hypothetical protein